MVRRINALQRLREAEGGAIGVSEGGRYGEEEIPSEGF